MKSDDLRRAWTEYFRERGHTMVPSAGLIPHHPTAPMFVNSGMMQFVPYFLGEFLKLRHVGNLLLNDIQPAEPLSFVRIRPE